MASVKIGTVEYLYIRSAIKAATTGATIDIDGTYDIRQSSPTALANPNTFSRFGAKALTFTGTGAISTIITGNARIYAGQSDRTSGVPTAITLKTLRLSYGESLTGGVTSAAGSGYILQSGTKIYSSGVLSSISSRIGTVALDGVSFTGNHTGAVGKGGGAPFGNYMDVAVSSALTFNSLNVALTGQGGGTFFSTNPLTYGSAFLLANGPQITITNSTFDESGYRNALSLWGTGSSFASNVTVNDNTFTRLTANKDIRTAGETLSNVSGEVKGNTFSEGAYLQLQSFVSPLTLVIGTTTPADKNTFNVLQGGYGVIFKDDQLASNLANVQISGNEFFGGLAVKSELSSGVLTFGANKVSNQTDGLVSFIALRVGGKAADTIIGGNGNEWISGDLGNDTLTGGSGDDAFVFATTPNPGNIDSITDFTPGSDKIWLDDNIYSGLSGSFFGVWITYNSGTGDLSCVGRGVFATLSSGLTLTQSDFRLF
jgi:Ca2+-binding RTX toxin-like protein